MPRALLERNRLGPLSQTIACFVRSEHFMKYKRKHLLFAVTVVVLGTVALFPLIGRKATASQTGEITAPTAAVVVTKRGTISNSLTLSGDFRPFQEVDVHAKIAGYIQDLCRCWRSCRSGPDACSPRSSRVERRIAGR